MSRAILLIHGFMTDPNDFVNLEGDLQKVYDYVCNPLLPGHGENGVLKEFTVDATFRCVENNYHELQKKYDEVDVLGFSMGGALATYLAAKYKVKHLILLAPANKYFNLRFIPNELKFYFKYAAFKVGKKVDENLKKEIEILNVNNSRSFHMAIKRLIPNYNLHTLWTFRSIVKQCNESLKNKKTKGLIIYGKCDQLVPYKSIKFVKKRFKNLKIIIFPDISHLMLRSENNEKIRNSVLNYLNHEAVK